ncbi:ribonuclease E activity regulator RraA [Plasticicumulans sp.]|uniref:ribonuclease E activity regulator RraA n=1 Tax=Plasticicumulans sp. TaxID=2307179 RepID=UPI000F90132B|nr:ribonuclease E activity regulator RraA [Plasticicumulans sp.]MBS0599600.1 ribonuclease E activity regulator RraA [Pseudomonadota bacterium]RTK98424.1 MAG: RraA family protein [Xanthomonadales bacterium]HMV39947.1 ribonuclease E activity regulator RraA [Plasticicumulans sp.]HMW29509.1 ribonuclease E activity regulator RraA [Plasticicumulans sp.]HMW41375.1 ribonuclease E activity regulator RraA [Plasticicumulans sp.]
MGFKTADLCDEHADRLQIAEPVFGDYGGEISFFGPITTLKAFEDNSLVRKAVEEKGEGRVLVIDSGGSMRCAMVGDQLAALAEKNGWAGVIVNGCIRDSAAIADTEIGCKALGVHPLKTVKRNEGQRDVTLRFAGVSFVPGHYLYADEDGLVVSEQPLF